MRKYILASISVGVAIIMLSFTNATNRRIENCSIGSYYYFEVVAPTFCNDVSEFNLPFLIAGPIASGFSAIQAQSDFNNYPWSDFDHFYLNNKWGCVDVSVYCCAVGFNFQDIEVGSDGRWKPKSIILYPICILEKDI